MVFVTPAATYSSQTLNLICCSLRWMSFLSLCSVALFSYMVVQSNLHNWNTQCRGQIVPIIELCPLWKVALFCFSLVAESHRKAYLHFLRNPAKHGKLLLRFPICNRFQIKISNIFSPFIITSIRITSGAPYFFLDIP